MVVGEVPSCDLVELNKPNPRACFQNPTPLYTYPMTAGVPFIFVMAGADMTHGVFAPPYSLTVIVSKR